MCRNQDFRQHFSVCDPQKKSYEFAMTWVNVIIWGIIHLGYCRPADRSNLPSCFCQVTVLFEEERGELWAFLSAAASALSCLLVWTCFSTCCLSPAVGVVFGVIQAQIQPFLSGPIRQCTNHQLHCIDDFPTGCISCHISPQNQKNKKLYFEWRKSSLF